MRRTPTRKTAIVAAALLALVACDPGDETNEGAQDVAVDGSEDTPAEDAPPEEAPPEDAPPEEAPSEEVPSADGDVEVEGPDGDATNESGVPPDGDPNWSGPPPDQVGVPIGLQPTIVEGDDAVVSLAGMTVYRDGIDLTMGIHWDPDDQAASEQPGATDGPGGPMDAFGTDQPPESEEDLPDELLRVELVYPDGSTASSVDHLLATAGGSEPEEPALNPYTGMGDERSWNQSLWTWPLPDEGDGSVRLIIDWPGQGIDEQQLQTDVDIDGLSEAAGQVVELWD